MTNKYAIIENGVVTNVVLADTEYAAEQGWVECPNAGPKWLYADGVFTKPDPVVVPVVIAPTREELIAQLNALSAQIQALE